MPGLLACRFGLTEKVLQFALTLPRSVSCGPSPAAFGIGIARNSPVYVGAVTVASVHPTTLSIGNIMVSHARNET